MELTNSIRKQIISLNEAKHRRTLGLFKAEGTKCVLDTIHSFKVEYLVATRQWIEEYLPVGLNKDTVIPATKAEMDRISSLSNSAPVVAVYEIPEYQFSVNQISENLSIALDCVQDPGNLGTIMRTADWFGIRDIFCSVGTADVYNPKVVQATMGAISRVRVHYVDLVDFFSSLSAETPIYGTFLDGEDISSAKLSSNGIIVMGNEGKGISAEVACCINKRITIPAYPKGAETSESLNVAIATAITVSQFRLKH